MGVCVGVQGYLPIFKVSPSFHDGDPSKLGAPFSKGEIKMLIGPYI